MIGSLNRFIVVCAAAAVAALALAACGGSDEAPIEEVTTVEESTDALVPKDDFIAQGDIRCAEANAAVAGISTGGGSAAELESAASREAAIYSGLVTELQSLGTPETDQELLDAYIKALQDLVAVLEKRRTAADRDDLTAYEGFATELTTARGNAATAGAAFGFEECGGEGSAVAPPTDGTTTTPTTTTPTTTTPAPPPSSGGTGTDGGGGSGSGGGDSGAGGGIAP